MKPRFRTSATSSAPRRFFRRDRRAASLKTGRLSIRKRPPAPPFWINIAPDIRKARETFPGKNAEERERLWLLVLQSKSIPYRFHAKALFPSLYVPPVAARVAAHEILSFESEKPVPPLPAREDQPGCRWYGLFLAPLVLWHYVRYERLPSFPSLPQDPAKWPALAGMDAYKVAALHEWWRSVTALTLHADAAHLVSNVVLGGIFGVLVCGYAGIGFGSLLILLAGAAGNIATAHLRPASALSIGFSTAVFATIGLLVAFSATRAAKHALGHKGKSRASAALKYGVMKSLPPLAAGLGLLAMFGGSDAPNVDYLAHVMGFFAGTAVGLCTAWGAGRLLDLKGVKNAVFQSWCIAGTFALVFACWRIALGGL